MNGFPNGVIDPILKKKEGHNQNAATPAPPEEANNESDSKHEHMIPLSSIREGPLREDREELQIHQNG